MNRFGRCLRRPRSFRFAFATSASALLCAACIALLPRTAASAPPAPVAPGVVPPAHNVSLNLHAVLRLAQEQNPRIALAREKVNESYVELEHASSCLLFGASKQIKSEAQVWRQKAELSQTTSDVLLEAANTYIDLLSARRGEALSRELEQYERKVLDRAEKLDKEERTPRGSLESVKASVANRQQTTAQLRQQGNAAAAKLAYLLGLPSPTLLEPEANLVPVELVDANTPLADLVAHATANGPTVRELEGLLAVIGQGLDRAERMCPLLHLVQYRQAQALSKQKQTLLALADVRGKFAAGASEARDAILFGREQIGLAVGQVKDAAAGYRENDKRLQEGLPGGSVADTLLAIRSLEQAHFNHTSAIANHNKAEVRLLLLLGAGPGHGGAAPHAGSAHPPAEGHH
jgi:outer membrane protein TolC